MRHHLSVALSRSSPLVRELTERLASAIGCESARQEVRWMRDALQEQHEARDEELSRMLARRVAGEPLQYILGTTPFGPLSLLTRAPVLIPRPETEDWALRLAELVRRNREVGQNKSTRLKVLDLCTGTGCIPLLLGTMLSGDEQGGVGGLGGTVPVDALGADVATEAVQLAQENGVRCGFVSVDIDVDVDVNNTAANTPIAKPSTKPGPENHYKPTFTPIRADILSPSFSSQILASLPRRLRPPYDILTSNPPYIPLREYTELPASVRDWEDPRALLGDPGADLGQIQGTSPPEPAGTDQERGGGDGLTFYRALARLVSIRSLNAMERPLVKEGGMFAFEVGRGQARAVEELVRGAGVRETEVWKDPWGVERVVFGRV
ncbi:S-adenosyl-L-methionine-dependent methyltransferase [Coniophora puteana RWD-64-598 SS2]|uniref:S-adenosyl-L-methionine-dependent methyltransferase n=1 Tax=Coniophora puteana (strain RWD-64-598) TaxID=741705 RepID=A0A5M3MVK4_CONPW|nr:S-adenosyl-L-methionine-dependent methyltransferase [Coniophora puteana RWD-64-598 SS2]EIW82744.1 S-adenosyl-L-methionine-dependent methyltransferase [Coniophora puteana RWD-64-598 SS2]